jgi:transcriptional regulator GlxA family with amidase domain
MQWLILRRIRAAQELLEETDQGVDAIAAATGFGTGELLRYHFRKCVGISPREWRQSRKLLKAVTAGRRDANASRADIGRI